MQADFDLRLDEPRKQFNCGRIELDRLRGNSRHNERRLVVAAFIGEEKKGQQQFTLICTSTIANFEGQLTVDPEQLNFCEDEYRNII